MTNFIKRVRCWLRGYHVGDAAHTYKFRYDASGVCHDCGAVGTGKQAEDGE